MAKQPDYTQAGEIYRKSMEEALANIDKVNEDLKQEQEKAIDLQIEAKEEFKRIQREAHQISEAYIEKHRKEYLEQIRNEVLLDVVRKLIVNEVPSDKLKTWLELSPKLITDAWFYIGFEALDERYVAHVGYDSQGRSGDVIFYRNDRTLHFPFEFGGGETLASVEIPTMENWEKETGLSQSDRNTILEFVAKRVIRDQASKCTYVIHPDRIQIKY
jgi:hypothetical protein